MVFINATYAQETWPKELVAPDGTLVRVFQPEPETLKGNILTYRAAISVKEKTMTEPAFGTFWGSATVATDRDNREILFTSLTVTDIRVPRDSASDRLDYIKAVIQSQLPAAAGPVPIDVIITSLNQQMDQTRLAGSLNMQPPVILYSREPSMLVTIDGAPRFEENRKWGLDAVVNTPFTIVKDKNGLFYCWGGGHWYSALAATGPYSPLTTEPDRRLRKIERKYKRSEPDSVRNAVDSITPAIIVTTSPAELIQTSGTPDLQPVGGSNLAGTNAAREAVMDAQIPQTDQRRPVWNINGKCRNEAPFGLPASSAPDPSPRRILADSVVAATTARPIIS